MPALFRLAVATGGVLAVKTQLGRGVNPDCRDSSGNTALILAASRGRTEICRLLLEQGADPRRVNRSGQTAHAMAVSAGHGDTASLLTEVTCQGSDVDLALIRPPGAPEPEADPWEIDGDALLTADDGVLRAKATAQQMRLTKHSVVGLDEDWADVVIDLPAARRAHRNTRPARDSVRFRRLRSGLANRHTASVPLHDAVVALDLSMAPDDILLAVSLAQVIRSADTSPELRKCVARSRLFEMTAAEFLADDEGEARFLRAPGMKTDDYLELADLMNAFTVLVHQEAGRGSSGEAVSPPEMPRGAPAGVVRPSLRRDPDEVLQATALAQIVLAGNSSSALRRALSRTDRFNMSAAEFLQEDDGEAIFRNAVDLDSRTYVELADLVNEFTEQLYRDTRL